MLLSPLLLFACAAPSQEPLPDLSAVDRDGDGYTATLDCNDEPLRRASAIPRREGESAHL
jgi:hypothetical protein